MELLSQIHATEALHQLGQALSIPVVIVLLLLALYAAYTVGSLIVELAVERRHYKAVLPKLIDTIDEAPYEELHSVMQHAGLLDTQREKLDALVDYAYLPDDSLTEVAKRLLGEEADRYERALGATEAASKIAPMLGLMGTLIPLGPGIVALSGGDLETLSSSLLMAFDTTIAGLLVAVVCFLVTKVRRRWYRTYLSAVESAMNAVLDKVENMREAGHVFERPATSGSGRHGHV